MTDDTREIQARIVSSLDSRVGVPKYFPQVIRISEYGRLDTFSEHSAGNAGFSTYDFSSPLLVSYIALSPDTFHSSWTEVVSANSSGDVDELAMLAGEDGACGWTKRYQMV